MKNTLFVTLLVTGLIVVPAIGQNFSLTTTFAGGNASAGNMFDVKALNDLTITGFDIHFSSGTDQFEVWYRQGSYLPFLNTNAGWTLAGVTGPVTSNGANVPTPLPLATCITIPALQTYGIYIHRQGGSLTYTDGIAQGAVAASDANLEIYEGHGGGYFNMINVPRVWNGTVHYTSPSPKALYQANTPQMSVTIDGAQGGPPCSPVIVNKDIVACTPITPATLTLTISSIEVGAYYDIFLSSQPLVAPFAGGFILSDGQIVNVDLFSPNTWFSSGTSTPALMTLPSYFPGATASTIDVGYSLSSATSLTLQGVVIAPAAPLGFLLSQATELNVNVVPPPTSVPGPTTTTSGVSIDVTTAPTCWCPGGIPFYGSAFSTMHVSANGHVNFGGTDFTDTTPSISDAINDYGRVGFWTDLDPSEGGTITISNPATDIIRVDWAGVFYNTGGPGISFGIEFDCATGVIQIDGLGGLVANPGISTTDDQWLGISPGITFAPTATTDPGAAPFGLGANGFAAAATDMLYEFNDTSVSGVGLPASVLGGMTSLVFTPDGMGNYTWAGM